MDNEQPEPVDLSGALVILPIEGSEDYRLIVPEGPVPVYAWPVIMRKMANQLETRLTG
jgi:hypothetical protein